MNANSAYSQWSDLHQTLLLTPGSSPMYDILLGLSESALGNARDIMATPMPDEQRDQAVTIMYQNIVPQLQNAITFLQAKNAQAAQGSGAPPLYPGASSGYTDDLTKWVLLGLGGLALVIWLGRKR